MLCDVIVLYCMKKKYYYREKKYKYVEDYEQVGTSCAPQAGSLSSRWGEEPGAWVWAWARAHPGRPLDSGWCCSGSCRPVTPGRQSNAGLWTTCSSVYLRLQNLFHCSSDYLKLVMILDDLHPHSN